ncbi:MAG: hemin uptake protein HemP [Dechloromonas sp.]|nr:hemin uptake protein HemP [Dechloromonas sp.]
MEPSKQTLRIPFLHANGPRPTLRLKPEQAAARTASCAIQCIASKALFGECNEICISHSGSEYRLRITRQGKLILTK